MLVLTLPVVVGVEQGSYGVKKVRGIAERPSIEVPHTVTKSETSQSAFGIRSQQAHSLGPSYSLSVSRHIDAALDFVSRGTGFDDQDGLVLIF